MEAATTALAAERKRRPIVQLGVNCTVDTG
jgi:hypothetical protein